MAPITEMLRQLSFVAAVLAGFAVAFVVGLLTSAHEGKSVDRTIVAALVATACLMMSTIAGVAGVMFMLDRPSIQAMKSPPDAILHAFKWSGAAFMLGMVALLLSVGLSGWIRSRTLGKTTTAIAVCTYIVLTYYLRVVLRMP